MPPTHVMKNPNLLAFKENKIVDFDCLRMLQSLSYNAVKWKNFKQSIAEDDFPSYCLFLKFPGFSKAFRNNIKC